jgi:hypothetical protein
MMDSFIKDNKRQLDVLKFLYDRFVYVYNENPNMDYMIRFKQIIDKYEKKEKRILVKK